jgi:hypothetical protein
MKAMVLLMTLALVFCDSMLAQDSTTCYTSKDGLSTRCYEGDTAFGVECEEHMDGSLTCTHYTRQLPPRSKSTVTQKEVGDYAEKALEHLRQQARDFDLKAELQRKLLEPCPKRGERRDDRAQCLDPRSYKKRMAEVEAEAKARAAEGERKAHDELCAAHQLPAEKCKP